MKQYHVEKNQNPKNTFLFAIFCVWTVIILNRPQDIFSFMVQIRPAFTFGLLTLFLFILRGPPSNLHKGINNPQVKLYSLLVIIMVLSIPFSIYKRASFMFFFTNYISVIMYFFIFLSIVDSPAKLIKIIFLACLGSGLYSASTLIKGEIISDRILFGGMFDPNDLAFFSLSFLFFNLLFISRDNNLIKRIICISNFIMGILLVFGTGSRGGIIAFSVVVLLLLVQRTVTFKVLYKIVFMGLMFIFIFTNIIPINIERYTSILRLADDYNIISETGRLDVWRSGLQIMLNKPFTGVGINCFAEAIGTDREERGLIPVWQAPHNSLIQIGVETGIAGFVLFALISLKAYWIFAKVRRMSSTKEILKIAEMARLGFIGHFITAIFLSQAYSIYWAFYIVLSAVLYRYLNDKYESIKKNKRPAIL